MIYKQMDDMLYYSDMIYSVYIYICSVRIEMDDFNIDTTHVTFGNYNSI